MNLSDRPVFRPVRGRFKNKRQKTAAAVVCLVFLNKSEEERTTCPIITA